MHRDLDCRGLLCPLPILQTRLALNTLTPGDTLQILVDDPGFLKDFPQFCQLAQLSLRSETRLTPTLTALMVVVQ